MEKYNANNLENYNINNDDVAKNNNHELIERWEPEDGYRWMRQNGIFVPADKEWQPLDLSPVSITEVPWPGDFCYLSQHPDCLLSKCQVSEKQLGCVLMVYEEEGLANFMLATNQTDMAVSRDVILDSKDARIPFDIAIELISCGTVYYNQLSMPVGYIDQENIDKLALSTLGFAPDFPKEKRSNPILDHKDSRQELISKHCDIVSKLSCYCVSKQIFNDDNGI
ncbi:MAG: hypothetical protein WCP03_00160 [Candidatus Saccharibacteria bacterium]